MEKNPIIEKKPIYIDNSYWYGESNGYIPKQMIIDKKISDLQKQAENNAKLDKTQGDSIENNAQAIEDNKAFDDVQEEKINQNADDIETLKNDVKDLQDTDKILEDEIKANAEEIATVNTDLSKAIWGIIYKRDHEIIPAIEKITSDNEEIRSTFDEMDETFEEMKESFSAMTEIFDEMGESMSAISEDMSYVMDELSAMTIDIENTAEIAAEAHDRIDSIELVQDSGSTLIYHLMVDGESKGDIDIPKDNFLSNASFNSETSELTFVWENGETTTVPLSSLIDVYEGSNAIDVKDNHIYLKLDKNTEDYLTITENGLSLSGIKDDIDTEQKRAMAKENENNVLIGSVAEWVKEIADNLSGLTSQVKTDEETISQNTKDIENLQNEVSDNKNFINSIFDEVSGLTTHVDVIDEEIIDIYDKLSAIISSEGEIISEFETLENDISGLTQQIDDEIKRAKDVEEGLDKRIQELEKTNPSDFVTTDALNAEIDRATSAETILSNEIEELKNIDHNTFATKDDLNAEIDRATSTETANKEIAENAKILANGNKETLDKLFEWLSEKQYLGLIDDVDKLKIKDNEFDTQLKTLEEQIPSLDGYATEQWVEDKKYVDEAWIEKQGFVKGLADILILQTDIEQLKKNDKTQDDRLVALETTVKDLTNTVEALKREIESMK